MFDQFLGFNDFQTRTFRLLSGPFQHLSPFVYDMNWYEFSNLSQSLFEQIPLKKIRKRKRLNINTEIGQLLISECQLRTDSLLY